MSQHERIRSTGLALVVLCLGALGTAEVHATPMPAETRTIAIGRPRSLGDPGDRHVGARYTARGREKRWLTSVINPVNPVPEPSAALVFFRPRSFINARTLPTYAFSVLNAFCRRRIVRRNA